MFRSTTATIAAALVALTTLVAGPATAAENEPPAAAAHATGWYIALGDSLAAGYQPTTGDDPTGGYVGRVLTDLRNADNTLRLENLACSGETVVTMAAGGHCTYPKGSQLDQALQFLHAHAKDTELVTVTIGANDVQRCVSRSAGGSGMSIDMACVANGLNTVATQLPTMLYSLRQAAPDAQIVVTNYYNPFLAAYGSSPALALQSAQLQELLNGAIAHAAVVANASVADVAGAFDSRNWAPVPGSNVPTNVALICQWTWMCSRTDIHANDLGYAVIARAVEDRVNRDALAA